MNVNQRQLYVRTVRGHMDSNEATKQAQRKARDYEEPDLKKPGSRTFTFQYAYLGSCSKTTFAQIEQEHAGQPAFTNFRVVLSKKLERILPQCQLTLPPGERVRLRKEDEVSSFEKALMQCI